MSGTLPWNNCTIHNHLMPVYLAICHEGKKVKHRGLHKRKHSSQNGEQSFLNLETRLIEHTRCSILKVYRQDNGTHFYKAVAGNTAWQISLPQKFKLNTILAGNLCLLSNIFGLHALWNWEKLQVSNLWHPTHSKHYPTSTSKQYT